MMYTIDIYDDIDNSDMLLSEVYFSQGHCNQKMGPA